DRRDRLAELIGVVQPEHVAELMERDAMEIDEWVPARGTPQRAVVRIPRVCCVEDDVGLDSLTRAHPRPVGCDREGPRSKAPTVDRAREKHVVSDCEFGSRL